MFENLFIFFLSIYVIGSFTTLCGCFLVFKKTKPGVEMNEEDLGDIVFIVLFWPFLLILLAAVFIVHLINEYIVPWCLKVANKILKYI